MMGMLYNQIRSYRGLLIKIGGGLKMNLIVKNLHGSIQKQGRFLNNMKKEELIWVRENAVNLALKYYYQFDQPPTIFQILGAAETFTDYLISGKVVVK